jgi:hypothetical protein
MLLVNLGLTLHIQNQVPGKEQERNSRPAPKGEFYVDPSHVHARDRDRLANMGAARTETGG